MEPCKISTVTQALVTWLDKSSFTTIKFFLWVKKDSTEMALWELFPCQVARIFDKLFSSFEFD